MRKGKRKREGKRKEGRADAGVSAVLGGIMMIALMMTLIPGAVLMRGAISDEMEAQRMAAERAAWCARHPTVGPPTCEPIAPMPGYDCEETARGVWLCTMETEPPVGELSGE